MTEMVEPDRTIMIVSIIGLVIIWGSFFYHKYVQGGSPPPEELTGKGKEEVEKQVLAAEPESGAREAATKGAGTARPRGKRRKR